MSRGTTALFKALVVVVLTIGLVGCASTRLKKENENLKAQVLQLNDSLAAAESESSRATAENQSLQSELEKTRADYAAKNAELEKMAAKLRAGGLDVTVREGMVVVTLPQQVLFDSGSAKISSGGRSQLGQLARALNADFKDFTVEVNGHTDTDPIVRTKDRYKSNWELSYDRAQTVAYNLIEQKVEPKRVKVTANSQYRPLASNTSSAGKAKNRRVEILVIRPAGQ